ncbi:MAG: hypothetical protein KTR32_05775, partial [Granulosicoccus sp.]|nr:hypothetical protein [Granulosicoccus sp.]
QVEHPVTEALTGIDLVELQLRVASGDALPLEQSEIKIQGHAVEARVYAEDVAAGFLPATGTLQHVNFSERVRYDTGVTCGDEITPYYDPMIAKLIASAGTRERAISRLHGALKETHIAGTITNIEFLAALTTLPEFIDAKVDTSLIDRHLDTLISESTPSGLSKLIGFLSLTDIDINTPMRGWRIWGEASHLLSVQFGAHTQRLRLVLHGDGSFSLQDEAATQLLARCSVECESDTTWRISMDDEIHRADVFSWNDRDVRCVSVLLDGQSAIYRCNDPLQVNTDTDEITDRIVAPMSGIIRQIDVSSGQSVNSGDRLLVLEAMKMETSVISPRDAVIKDIHCQLDDAVDGGSVLISLEETK